mmetsp:Transcript_77204/g.184844  ORF Transcript_77204/g.184844 Transcript_77204/m.184844 type:complete len:663 (-) Transcript_77204:184-2172(-)
MEQRESDLAVVCRLAHEHLSDGPAARNDVLRRLPRDFRSGVDEIVKDIHTSIEVPPLFNTSGGTLSFIFRKLVTYQTQQNHHQPPGRFQRLTSFSAREANSCDNFHAKRVVCEVLKTWACCSHGAVSDESVDAQEVEPYLNFLRHLLYFHDRWSSKLWGSDSFLEIMVQTIRKLEALKRDSSDTKQKYLRVLEQIYDSSSELAENALRVAMLAVSEHHVEFETVVTKEGPMTLKLLSKAYYRHNSSFWCTDLGQVLNAALVRADPLRFKPIGTGTEKAPAARVWSLWTDELGTIKMYEYGSLEEARQVLEQCRCCTVLVGPEGKIQEKSLAAGSQMLSKVLQEGNTLRELNRRVDQNISLQRAALGLPPEQVTAIEDFLGQEVEVDVSAEAQNYWYDAVQKVRDEWMQGRTEVAGVAEPFRGGKKVKWIEGVFEKGAKSSDFPTIILDLPKTLSELLSCHKEVMSAVRGMISEGGSKEALAAIYALRQRGTITGQLDACMQRCLASANLIHGFYEHLFFDGLESGKKIKGQTASMQRLYFESYRACSKMRDDILTKWHKLGLQVTDDNLAEEAKRIDMTERAAFCQLMGMPAPNLALTAGSTSQLLQLPDSPAGNEASPTGTPRSDKQIPITFAPSARVEELKPDLKEEATDSGDDLSNVFS